MAAGTLSKLFVRIGADTKEFQAGMSNVQGRMAKLGQGMSDFGKSMSMKVTAPIMAGAAALGAIAKKTANYGEEVLMASEKTGTSVEGFQEMKYALEQLGFDDAEKALGRLNQRMGRAKDGNEKYQQALERLGVPMQEVKNGTISTDQAMKTAISTLRNMESEQERSAAASELFGTRLARELMPALRDSEASVEELMQEAQDLGIVMDKEGAQSSEKFNDALHRLREQFSALTRDIGMEIIPILTDTVIPLIEDRVIPAIRGFAERVAGLIEWFGKLEPRTQTIVMIITALAAALGPVLIVVGQIIMAISTVMPIISKVGALISGVALGPLAIAAVAIGAVVAIWRNWEWIVDFVSWFAGRISNLVGGIVGGVTGMFGSMRDRVVGIFGTMWDGIKTVINYIIDGMNYLIRGMNRISIDIPDWVPRRGGETFGIDINEIPQLQTGGRINVGGAAIVGERGPELLELPSSSIVSPTIAGSGQVVVQNMNVRRESDIDKIAKKLNHLNEKRDRRLGP